MVSTTCLCQMYTKDYVGPNWLLINHELITNPCLILILDYTLDSITSTKHAIVDADTKILQANTSY